MEKHEFANIVLEAIKKSNSPQAFKDWMIEIKNYLTISRFTEDLAQQATALKQMETYLEKNKVTVKMPATLRFKMEKEAEKTNLPFHTWLKEHLAELTLKYPEIEVSCPPIELQ